MKELKQRLESTEQDEERKKLMKEIDIKDLKNELAKAKWVSSYVCHSLKVIQSDLFQAKSDVI